MVTIINLPIGGQWQLALRYLESKRFVHEENEIGGNLAVKVLN